MFLSLFLACIPFALLKFVVMALVRIAFYEKVHDTGLMSGNNPARRAWAAMVFNPRSFFQSSRGRQLMEQFIEIPTKEEVAKERAEAKRQREAALAAAIDEDAAARAA